MLSLFSLRNLLTRHVNSRIHRLLADLLARTKDKVGATEHFELSLRSELILLDKVILQRSFVSLGTDFQIVLTFTAHKNWYSKIKFYLILFSRIVTGYWQLWISLHLLSFLNAIICECCHWWLLSFVTVNIYECYYLWLLLFVTVIIHNCYHLWTVISCNCLSFVTVIICNCYHLWIFIICDCYHLWLLSFVMCYHLRMLSWCVHLNSVWLSLYLFPHSLSSVFAVFYCYVWFVCLFYVFDCCVCRIWSDKHEGVRGTG